MIDAEADAFPVAEIDEEGLGDGDEMTVVGAVGKMVLLGRHIERDAQEDSFCME